MREQNEIVCVVDEDASIRRSLKRLISLFDFNVKTFYSLASFSQMVSADETICLIVDEYSLKDEDTRSFLNGFSDLRIIVSTTRDSRDVRHLARNLSADMCLQKPIDDQALLDSIKWSFAKK